MGTRFGRAVKQIINGREVGDGLRSLSKQFENCIQNRRSDPDDEGRPTPCKSRPLKGKTPIGVLGERYCPRIVDKEGQEVIKLTMSTLLTQGWEEDDVKEDLQKCFSLIRDDIVKLTEKVDQLEQENAINPQQNEEDSMDVDDPEPGIFLLKREWPFLFHPFGLDHHHNHLTGGRDLKTPLNSFVCSNRLFYLATYLVCSSPARKENLALRVRIEGHHDMQPDDRMFLMTLLMLANHFKESPNEFIIPAEVSKRLFVKCKPIACT